ncbi:MAG: phenylacetate--CoA ligase [Planctomycetia bacterium]|nr:phenylacetate--CoA ligase [Planctomycetia bacterium]
MSEILTQGKPFNEEIWSAAECLSRDEIQALQLTRLRETVARVKDVPLYKDFFQREKISPESIRTLDDIRRLPFTTKAQLRENYPLNYLTVPREKLVRVHGSSGTHGKPTFVGYTREDIYRWADLCARFLYAGMCRAEHLVQVSFGYGLFTGGFGLHYGIERIGASILPAASGNTPRQIMLLQDLKADGLIATPSYALNIAEVVCEMGIKPSELPLKYAHFGAEAWTEEMRVKIEDQLGIKAYNNYGLSEILGPGVSGECRFQNGMHIQEDEFFVECLNPETLEPVAPGESGELVITNLNKEAMSLLRYRTRDIAVMDDSPCPCGRTTRRMGRVMGRSDDMLVIRGVNVFPTQVEEAILKVEGVTPHFLMEVTRPKTQDELTVYVEIQPDFFSDKMSEMENLRSKILHEIHVITGLRVNLVIKEPKSLERFTGKAKRVIDKRDLHKIN